MHDIYHKESQNISKLTPLFAEQNTENRLLIQKHNIKYVYVTF